MDIKETKEIANIPHKIPISSIFVGSLDARYDNINLFRESYMVFPDERIIESLLRGDKFYIDGNKGTGKTALMLYLSNQITEKDPEAICSTILFKTEYSSEQKYRIESFERKKIETLDICDIEVDSLISFQNIWKLIIFLKIVSDNHNNNYTFFEKDTNWEAFENLILRLSNTADIGIKDRLSMLKSIPKQIVFQRNILGWSISEEQVPLQDATPIELADFDKALQIAEYLFAHLSRTEKNYFIFVDELETYCASPCFMRDLRMIRDWIEVTWSLNRQFKDASYKNIKIALSVRSEILAAIARNLCGDELNKKIASYKVSIDWRNKYENGMNSPLFGIWLRKIANTYPIQSEINNLEIRRTWFPPSIGVFDTVDFILNRTWNKPRDIIRFMSIAKDLSLAKDYTYTEKLIVSVLEEYSKGSKEEITEEMSLVYNPADINLIFSSLQEFQIRFSFEEYEKHVSTNYSGEAIFDDMEKLLSDLYRFGIVGYENLAESRIFWNHLSDPYMMGNRQRTYIIHQALRPTLGLEQIMNDGINIYEIMANPLECKVIRSNKSFVYVTFMYKNQKHKGAIHVSKWGESEFIEDISKHVTTGQITTAYVLNYDKEHKNWNLTCNADHLHPKV